MAWRETRRRKRANPAEVFLPHARVQL